MNDNGSVIVREFLNYLSFEKRFSEHTAKCYGADMSQFGEFLTTSCESSVPDTEPVEESGSQNGTLASLATLVKPRLDELLVSVQVDDVRAYLALLNEKQYSKSTIARKLATLRSFYKFLVHPVLVP